MIYHFSEQHDIEQFVPRAPLAYPEAEPLVWAIDEWHAPLYYFPPECPRVCFWPLPRTSEEDLSRWWLPGRRRMVIAMEHGWVEQMLNCKLYRYSFALKGFADCHDHGVFVSRETITPLGVQPVGPLLEEIERADVELRILPSLVEIGEAITSTTMHFSLIRMRNATGWRRRSGSPTVPRTV